MNKPGVNYGGLTASTPSVGELSRPPINSHTPLFFVLSSDGSQTAQITSAANVSQYGDIGRDKSSVHRTHQNAYLLDLLDRQGTAIVNRLTLPAATHATLRFSLEVILSSLPLYDRDEFGQYIKDQYDEPIPIGTIDGFRTIIHAQTDVTVGDGVIVENYRSGTTLSPITQEYLGTVAINDLIVHPSSTLYPLFDLQYANVGSGGNQLQVEIARGANHPFKIRLVLDRRVIADVEFSLDGDLDRLDALNLPSLKVPHIYSSSIATVKELLLYGTDYQGVHFNGVDDYLMVFESEVVSDAAKASIREDFDLFSLQFKDGVPYPAVINDSKWFDGTPVGEGSYQFLAGGSDGYPLNANGDVDRLELLRLFDSLASATYRAMSLGQHPLCDPVRFPYRSIYDSGYSMQTKVAMAAVKKSRPEVQVFVTPYSVADFVPVLAPVISCDGATHEVAIKALDLVELYTLEIDGQVVAEGLTLLQLVDALNSTEQVEAELLKYGLIIGPPPSEL